MADNLLRKKLLRKLTRKHTPNTLQHNTGLSFNEKFHSRDVSEK